MSQKRVGLALGGGAARGLAHVGVIRVLEREGIPIDVIAGTSVGAVVGAAYAGGVRGKRLLEMALEIRWRHIARPTWPRQGFLSFDRLESYTISLIGDVTFAELDMPYAAVSADLATGEEVVMREGRVAPAVRASCSVPGIVRPAELDGRTLVDGGVVNGLPISVAHGLGADVVIAIGLSVPAARVPQSSLQIGLAALDYLLLSAGDDPTTAEVYIPIPLHGLGSLVSLRRSQESIALGSQAAEEALPAIRAALR